MCVFIHIYTYIFVFNYNPIHIVKYVFEIGFYKKKTKNVGRQLKLKYIFTEAGFINFQELFLYRFLFLQRTNNNNINIFCIILMEKVFSATTIFCLQRPFF